MDSRYSSYSNNFLKLTLKRDASSIKKLVGCSTVINQNFTISYKCRIVITISQKSTSPTIVKFYLLKYNRAFVFPLNNAVSPSVSYKYPAVQRLFLTSDNFPSREFTFFVINTTTSINDRQGTKYFRH